LKVEKYQNNPFSHWKKELHKDGCEAMLIAAIPFVRNIAEFSGDDENFLRLTSLLHIKEETESITVLNLQEIYKDVLKDKDALVLSNPKTKVIDLIYNTADNILNHAAEDIDLENKIVLAIAIRLKAEQYMIAKLNNENFWKGIIKNQTFALYEKFIHEFETLNVEISLLKQVNLMTPENIHINSFMYEPILDMSNQHLKQLYIDIKGLIA
jgi:hypothetical protein